MGKFAPPLRSYHVNQLGDLQSEAYFDGVVGVLDGPDPALVSLEEVPEESVLHLRQGHKLALGWSRHMEDSVERTGRTSVSGLIEA